MESHAQVTSHSAAESHESAAVLDIFRRGPGGPNDRHRVDAAPQKLGLQHNFQVVAPTLRIG